MGKKIINLGFLVCLILAISGCKKESNTANLQDFFTLRNKGADMPVWVEGNLNSNALVIVVHGGPGGDGQVYNTYMKEFSDEMEAQFAMVYWDQRGSGNSAGHFSSDAYTIDTYIDDLDQLINVLKKKYGAQRKIFLMGHSWGGTLITAYTLDAGRQAKLTGFIEVDGAHDFKSVDVLINRFNELGNQQIGLGNHVNEWTEIVNYCKEVDANNASDEQIIKLNQYGFTAEQYLTDVDSIVDLTGTTDVLQYAVTGSLHLPLSKWNELVTSNKMFSTLKNADFTSQMGSIKIPSLFIWGRFDMVVPRASGISGYNQCGASDKTYAELLRSGHSPMLNQQKDFTSVVIPWIKNRL